MISEKGLKTQAIKGHSLILAILKAIISRGLDISPDEVLGLDMTEILSD